jgi:hypothetical protein
MASPGESRAMGRDTAPCYLHEKYFLSGDHALTENGSATGGWAQPEPNRSRHNRSLTKMLHLQRILPMKVPRPGVEPGLEVPETSVMSFSLPGLIAEQAV